MIRVRHVGRGTAVSVRHVVSGKVISVRHLHGCKEVKSPQMNNGEVISERHRSLVKW